MVIFYCFNVLKNGNVRPLVSQKGPYNPTNGVELIPDLVSKFTSKKLAQVHNPTPDNEYRENKEIRFKTAMLRSDLCDYSDAFVEVSANIVVKVNRINDDNTNNFNGVSASQRTFTLKNNAPFASCITKINGELIENAEDLDVMPTYNLIEYSKNFRKTNRSLHNYFRDEPKSEVADGINYSIRNSDSFDYKAKLTERFAGYATNNAAGNDDHGLAAIETKIIVPLKPLGNFWRELNMPLVNCEVELKLKWNKNCVLVNKATADARAAQGVVAARTAINTPTAATLNVTGCKLYIPVVTLRAIDETKLLNNLKTGFKRTITWNKYRSQITNQAINNNLNYLIDPTFTNVHRLFVLVYENEDDRQSYSKYYVPTVELKNYNVIVDSKPFFELPVRNMEET